MVGNPQFSLRSLFLAMLWIGVTFGLLRLLPSLSPARLVTFFAIDSSQQAPFVLLVPGALLVAAAAAFGAAIGTLRHCSRLYAIRFSKLAFATMAVYFAVMAWAIWPDNFLTFLYTAALLPTFYVLYVGRRFAAAARLRDSILHLHNWPYVRTLVVLMVVVSVAGIVAFGAVEIILAAIPYLACIAAVKRLVLADNATLTR